jgi:hypothetical protein
VSNVCRHAFALFFAGAETPVWRGRLEAAKVPHVSLNFPDLLARMGQKRDWKLADHFPEETEVFITSGGGKRQKDGFSYEAYFDTYCGWLEDNIERISYYTEYDPKAMGPVWIAEHRPDILALAPEKFVPLWHADSETHERLHALADRYRFVGIVGDEDGLLGRLSTLQQSTGCKFHAASVGKVADLRRTPYSSATTLSWITPSRYGDTQVWHSGKMNWYPAKRKEDARRRHSLDVEMAGFDPELWLADDRDTVVGFTLWSWRQLEEGTSAQMVERGGTSNIILMSDYAVEHQAVVAHQGPRDTAEGLVVQQDSDARQTPSRELVVRDKVPFPGMSQNLLKVQVKEGEEERQIAITRLGESGLRRCDSCALASKCPAFAPGNACAYKLPVQIRTKDQANAAMESVIEMQLARVAFARMNEEADGIPLDPAVSGEMTRFFGMLEKMRDIQADPSFFSLRIEGRGQPAPGFISQIMGAAMGAQALRQAQAVDAPAVEQVLEDFLDVDPID